MPALLRGVCQDSGAPTPRYRPDAATLRNRSLEHYRLGEEFFQRKNYQSAVSEYRQAHRASTIGVPITEPIQKTDPEYTEEARLAELEGTVVLSGAIGEDGFAHDLEVIQPLGLGLDENAVEAVKQWHFAPSMNQASRRKVPSLWVFGCPRNSRSGA